MNKIVCLGIGLFAGAGIGAGVTYILTKNACEKRTQIAIDEMKNFYESDKHNEIKGFVLNVKEGSDEAEKEIVKIDKPPISELSSILNSGGNSSDLFTDYHHKSGNEDKEKEVDDKVEKLKKKIKDITEKPEKENKCTVIDHAEYVNKQNYGYLDRDYSYEPGTEQWTDEYSGSEVSIEELPFDPAIIQWNDLDQCYILDEERHSVYMLESI